jgi:hypothetical protein
MHEQDSTFTNQRCDNDLVHGVILLLDSARRMLRRGVAAVA